MLEICTFKYFIVCNVFTSQFNKCFLSSKPQSKLLLHKIFQEKKKKQHQLSLTKVEIIKPFAACLILLNLILKNLEKNRSTLCDLL